MRSGPRRAQASGLVGLEAHAEQPTAATLCAHPRCSRRVRLTVKGVPEPGWACVHVRRYAEHASKLGVLYICPDHAVEAVERQVALAL